MHRINRKLTLVTILINCAIQLSCSSPPVLGNKETIFYPQVGKNPRVQFLTTFSDPSLIGKPYGVTSYQEKIFIVDSRASMYLILNNQGKIIKRVSGKGDGRLQKPINISIDSEGNRFVTDTGRKKLFMFDKLDHFVRSYGGEKFNPADVFVYDDKLYVSNVENHNIWIFDKESGQHTKTFGKIGSKQGELFYPTHIAITKEGDLLITDSGNYRVQIFNKNGNFIAQIGEAGRGFGQFTRPKGVATDHEGNIYVVDAAFENVQLFDEKGNLLLVFGEPGDNNHNINLPADISISYNGVENFARYADPRFSVEYLIFVTSQFGPNKISIYGFGNFKNN